MFRTTMLYSVQGNKDYSKKFGLKAKKLYTKGEWTDVPRTNDC